MKFESQSHVFYDTFEGSSSQRHRFPQPGHIPACALSVFGVCLESLEVDGRKGFARTRFVSRTMPSGVEADATRRHAITAGMNLSVLRRLDPAVTAVLCSSSQVAVYELPNSGSDDSPVGWQRCEIEGSLYIVLRASSGDGEASHRVVVVNRKSRDNFVDDITPSGMELETAQQMIMYKNAAGRVLGLWFYVAEELDAVYEVMNAVAEGRPPPPPPVAPAPIAAPLAPQEASVAAAGANGNGKPGKKTKQSSSNPKRKAPASRAAPIPAAETPSGIDTSGQGAPSKKIAADDSLARFFPNLKLTNGVAGESPPANAKRAPSTSENEVVASGSPAATEQATAITSTERPHVQPPVNVAPSDSSVSGLIATAPVVMPLMPPASLPPPQFAPNPLPAPHYQGHANALMMNISMLQRQDLMLSSQIQQAVMHASTNGLGDVQQTMYHTQRAQNLQRQQMQTRQQIAHLQPQLAIAQSQAVAGLHPRAPPPAPQTFVSMSSPAGLTQSTLSVAAVSPEESGSGRPVQAKKAQGPLSEEENAAVAGKAVTVAGQSFAPSTIMDKGQFRGLLQRLLHDNKLFDCAYAAHVTF